MIEKPEITQLGPRHIAVIHLTLLAAEMPQLFGPAVGELMSALDAQGQQPAGPVFAHHFHMNPDMCSVPNHFDFEVGVPLNSPIAAFGRMKPSVWPSMVAARTTYRGPYEGLPQAWGEFTAWTKAERLKPAMDLYESYATGPHTGPDPFTWRTELIRPLLD